MGRTATPQQARAIKSALGLPQTATAAEVYAKASQRARDNAINAAVRARKIPASSKAVYAAQWDQNPRATRDLLDGLEPGSVAASQPAASAPSSRLQVNAEGQLTYRGFPVHTAGGRPQVFTDGGWAPVDDVAASAISDDDLSYAHQQVRTFPDGNLGRLYREGPK